MTLQQQIRANRWRTLWLLFLFAVLVGVLGLVLGYAFDPSLLIVVGVVGILYGIFSWISAGKIVANAWTVAARFTRGPPGSTSWRRDRGS